MDKPIITPPILIVGAGPAGLILAIHLQKENIPYHIIQPKLTIPPESKAIVVQARTLELYDRIDPELLESIVKAGYRCDGFEIWLNGAHRGGISFKEAGKDQTKFNYALSLSQNFHEQVLEAHLEKLGGKVERGKRMETLIQDDDGVDVTIATLEGDEVVKEETRRYLYVVGCDGAKSKVRRLAGITMTGETYPDRFWVADVDATGKIIDMGGVNNCCGYKWFMMVFPQLTATRITGAIPENCFGKPDEEVSFDDVKDRVDKLMKIKVSRIQWFTIYRCHRRVADSFRNKRLIIAGDAAHLHTPVGGQGLNTGAGDIVNLYWKLATAWRAQSSIDAGHNGNDSVAHRVNIDKLLDSYQEERRMFAHSLVKTTDQLFTIFSDPGWRGWLMRVIIMPYILPTINRFTRGQASLMPFAKAAQLLLEYRDSPLSQDEAEGKAQLGKIKAGDRFPPQLDTNGETGWKIFVVGGEWIGEEWKGKVKERDGVRVKSLEAGTQTAHRGLVNGVYVVRPDGYVGLAMAGKTNWAKVEDYIQNWVV